MRLRKWEMTPFNLPLTQTTSHNYEIPLLIIQACIWDIGLGIPTHDGNQFICLGKECPDSPVLPSGMSCSLQNKALQLLFFTLAFSSGVSQDRQVIDKALRCL